jgi:hypothetical protein
MTFTDADLLALDPRILAEIDPEEMDRPTGNPGGDDSAGREHEQEEMTEDAG